MKQGAWYVLEGLNPDPWAIGPLSVGRKGPRGIYPIVGRNLQLDNYKKAVQEVLLQKYGPQDLIEGPIELGFFFWRVIDEYKTTQSRTARKHEADLTNLIKATEDALQGVLFKNDKDVKRFVKSEIVEQGPNAKPCVVIYAAPASTDKPDLPDHVWAEINEQPELDYSDDADDIPF